MGSIEVIPYHHSQTGHTPAHHSRLIVDGPSGGLRVANFEPVGSKFATLTCAWGVGDKVIAVVDSSENAEKK